VVGPPYPAVVRLHLIAQERWVEIDGEAALAGHDLADLNLRRYLNAVYVWCTRRIKEDDLDRWMFELNAPFPGQPPTRAVSEAQAAVEGEGFMSFASAFGVKAPATG
jgi:hypothetical protein